MMRGQLALLLLAGSGLMTAGYLQSPALQLRVARDDFILLAPTAVPPIPPLPQPSNSTALPRHPVSLARRAPLAGSLESKPTANGLPKTNSAPAEQQVLHADTREATPTGDSKSPSNFFSDRLQLLAAGAELKSDPTVRIFDDKHIYVEVLRQLGRRVGFVCGKIQGNFVPLTYNPSASSFEPGQLLGGSWPRELEQPLQDSTLRPVLDEAIWKLQCEPSRIRAIVLWAPDDARVMRGAIVEYAQAAGIPLNEVSGADLGLMSTPLNVVVRAIHRAPTDATTQGATTAVKDASTRGRYSE